MSLALRILAVLLLLGAALTVRLGADGSASWQAMERARATHTIGQRSALLLDAAAALATERGLMNGLLANPAAAPQSLRAAIAAQRQAAERAIAAATDGLAELPLLRDGRLPAGLAALRNARDRVTTLRQDADSGAGAPSQATWFAAATTQIEAVTWLRRLLDAANNEENDVTRLIAVRDALGDMAEYTGRERGLINGAIAGNQRLTAADMAEIGLIRGRVEAAWARIQPRLEALPPSATGPIRAAGDALFQTFAASRAKVLDAAAHGTPWPMTSADWFAAATAAIDAMRAGQIAATRALDQAMQQRADNAWRGLLLSLGLLAAAALVAGAATWYLLFRVVRPLNAAIGALHGLATGQLDITLPPARGHDEIGRLLQATHRFQETTLAHRALEERQAALQRQATSARVEAIHEVGRLIESESGQAVQSVAGLAERAAGIATTVSQDVAAIDAAARAAAALAADGRRESDAAATAARQLSQAIREVARQMATAASTSRDAVARAAETRGSFEALFGSVTEVQDVARLIESIAGRTNLLALNATIEAARAGEAGKGFAVVATEVKQLAHQTAQSTGQIASRVAAIEAAARRAEQALDGIIATVHALDSIAAQVAAAVEQQSAATGQISEAVHSTSAAAGRTADQVSVVTEVAARCVEAVQATQDISAQTVQQISGLQTALMAILRARVAELDRRTSERSPTALPARLLHAGGATGGMLRDLSAGGARFEGDAPPLTTASLQVAGLPTTDIRVVHRDGTMLHLAFVFANAEERYQMEAAVGRLSSRAAIADAA